MARRQSNPKQPQGLPKGVSLRHRLRLGSTTYSVAVSSDGRRAVTGSEHGKLKVWDLESGRQVHSIEGHRKARPRLGFEFDTAGRLSIDSGAGET
jgi:WD40 repeat protein